MIDHVGVVCSDLKQGRDHYRPHYCAYLLDFDGNHIEAGVYA